MNAQGAQSFQQIGSGIRLLYESEVLFFLKNFAHLFSTAPCRNDKGERGMKRADFPRKLIPAAVGKLFHADPHPSAYSRRLALEFPERLISD
jgi:hypothetical protein